MRLHASLLYNDDIYYTERVEWEDSRRVQWNFDVVPERGASAAVAEL